MATKNEATTDVTQVLKNLAILFIVSAYVFALSFLIAGVIHSQGY
jgi:hypothetical protein